jgi:hypothetical protein
MTPDTVTHVGVSDLDHDPAGQPLELSAYRAT